jgi:uncharacterized protein (TIGR02996 family)
LYALHWTAVSARKDEPFVDDGPTDPHRTLDPDERQRVHDQLTGDELVAAVYANPETDEPRLVYGDYLLERDDPRGEFIQLQLARHGTRQPATERESELVAAHSEAWLGPLYAALVPGSVVFERGFVARCVAADGTLGLRDAIGHPMWITVVELASTDAALVTHRCLRSLQRLRTTTEVLAQLARAGHDGLEHVTASGIPQRSDERRYGPISMPRWRTMLESRGFGRLRSFASRRPIDPDDPQTTAFLRSPFARDLDTLELATERCELGAWERVMRDHPRLRRIAARIEMPSPFGAQPLGLRSEGSAYPGGVVALERTGAEVCAVLELTTDITPGTIETVLLLPLSFHRLELRAAGFEVPALFRQQLVQRFAEIIER